MSRPVLSICLVNWNTREELLNCLESLRRFPYPGGQEIIVVDNGSQDGSAEAVKANFPEVHLVALDSNKGYAKGNNLALELASGEFHLLLNPDVEVLEGSLEILVDFMRNTPKAGGCAPLLLNPDGTVQASFRRFPTPDAVLAGLVEALGLKPTRPYKFTLPLDSPPVQVEQPMASAFCLRAEAVAEVGGLDEDFPLFFNDVDLCLRLKEAGWEIWAVPASRVIHLGGASTRQVRVRALFESHRSLVKFYEKHYKGKLNPLLWWAVVLGAKIALPLRIADAKVRAGRQRND